LKRKPRILVVDDDSIILESCRKILESEGYSVKLVTTAEDAIECLESQYFDMMIMDVKMPRKDGVYLLERIRENWPLDIWPELPVLVMTGYPTPETIKVLKEKGSRSFIPKPFTPDELLTCVDKVLKRSKINEKEESAGN